MFVLKARCTNNKSANEDFAKAVFRYKVVNHRSKIQKLFDVNLGPLNNLEKFFNCIKVLEIKLIFNVVDVDDSATMAYKYGKNQNR